MTEENRAACQAMLLWLEARHTRIMEIEAEAKKDLANNDANAYGAKMRAKAENLAAIRDDARDLLAGLPDSLRAGLANDLTGFATGARTALGLDSVFYMSALLYPDDYQPGQMDNLERCIENFRSGIARKGE